MPADHLLTERRGAVGVITLNRPEVRNAFDDALTASLTEVLLDLNRDESVRTVVLAGAGKAFCAGAEIRVAPEGEEGIAAFLDKRQPSWVKKKG